MLDYVSDWITWGIIFLCVTVWTHVHIYCSSSACLSLNVLSTTNLLFVVCLSSWNVLSTIDLLFIFCLFFMKCTFNHWFIVHLLLVFHNMYYHTLIYCSSSACLSWNVLSTIDLLFIFCLFFMKCTINNWFIVHLLLVFHKSINHTMI